MTIYSSSNAKYALPVSEAAYKLVESEQVRLSEDLKGFVSKRSITDRAVYALLDPPPQAQPHGAGGGR